MEYKHLETNMADINETIKSSGVEIDLNNTPEHIAIIMDGNGRWAKNRGMNRSLGHYHGYLALREIVRICGDLNIKVLTVYAFSTENWNRPQEEVDALMTLFAQAASDELPLMMEENVQLRVLGRFHELPEEAQQSLEDSIKATSGNTRIILNLAINYGGRKEIIDAIKIACNRTMDGSLELDKLTEQDVSGMMYTAGLPDPDLVIRTAGEMRVSNFLLWQIAYSELWVTSTLWPDFTQQDLICAISDFQKRERRFGKISNQPNP